MSITAAGSARLGGLALCAALVLACPPALAGTVALHNGDRLTGEIDSVSGGRLLLRSDYAGQVRIKLDAISYIETTAEFRIRLRNGTRMQGKLVGGETPAGITQHLAADGETPQPLALTAIAGAVRSQGDRRVASSEWGARVAVMASTSSGNSDTEAVNTRIESSYKRNRSEHAMQALVSHEGADGQRTKEQFDIDYDYRRFLSNKWFTSINAEYFRDRLQETDLRIALGAGIGYRAWQDSFGALSMTVGPSTVFEDISTDATENLAWRWSLNFNRFFWSKRAELVHRHSLLVIPDGARGEVIEAYTGVRLAVNEHLGAEFGMDHRIDTKPAQGAKKTDTTYNVGVSYSF